MVVGVISDTHGLLRPEALTALQGSEHILHAGDVGDPAILTALRGIAPLTAIRGNVDRFGECGELPETEAVELGGKLFYLVHSLADLDIDVAAAGIDCVLSGHSHQPGVVQRGGVIYLNPGSAGPRRFKLPVTVARVVVGVKGISAEIVEILKG
jgi:putative phosphoesterase